MSVERIDDETFEVNMGIVPPLPAVNIPSQQYFGMRNQATLPQIPASPEGAVWAIEIMSLHYSIAVDSDVAVPFEDSMRGVLCITGDASEWDTTLQRAMGFPLNTTPVVATATGYPFNLAYMQAAESLSNIVDLWYRDVAASKSGTLTYQVSDVTGEVVEGEGEIVTSFETRVASITLPVGPPSSTGQMVDLTDEDGQGYLTLSNTFTVGTFSLNHATTTATNNSNSLTAGIKAVCKYVKLTREAYERLALQGAQRS